LGVTLSDPRKYWVGFNLVKGIGAVRLQMLLDSFGDLATAWNASGQMLRQAGLGRKQVEAFLQVRSNVDLDMILQRIQDLNINVITWEDAGYPRRLKEIDQSPPVIYVHGALTPDDDFAVAIVGTRRVTAYGRQVTQEIATELVRNGLTVVSGLARGVDAIAHSAAMQAGGRTLAVMGSGVDRIYPPEHRRLAESIVPVGALLSDYPLGAPPDAANFPPRNRIISGLSLAVVVVEAGERSGALITASFAADQGRDVFAVPGNINAPQSAGTNRLIQKGAHPYLGVQDLLETLNLTLVTEQRTARRHLPTNEMEARLLDLLTHQPQHVDELSHQANLPIATITATLAMMELKGMVQQVGGMQYISLHEQKGDYLVEQNK
jgi:DNA processing protein